MIVPDAHNDIALGYTIAALPLLLLVSAIVLFLFRKREARITNTQLVFLGSAALMLSSCLVYVGIGQQQYFSFEWFKAPQSIFITVGLDSVGALMLGLVAFITALVVIYSTSYMKGERGYARYFASLFLFAMSMVGIVLSFNLLLTFIFWELVGFCSYLLINFWYDKPSANEAARKAFITNRVGDIGFLMALGFCYAEFGTFELDSISVQQGVHNEIVMFLIGLGVFLGCVGKSAQFPLLVWLPDAMEAPTPVSALLHAATMVAAGVFLLARALPLFHPDLLISNLI